MGLVIVDFGKYFERNEKRSKIFVYLGEGLDCATASYAGIAGSSPTENEQKFAAFFIVS